MAGKYQTKENMNKINYLDDLTMITKIAKSLGVPMEKLLK